MVRLGTGLLFVLRVANSAPARAGSCPPISGGDPSLARVDAEERLQFIRACLGGESRRARSWSTAWSVGYGMLTGVQLALIPFFDDPGTRADLIVGASSSAIGLASLLILPLRVMHDQETFESQFDKTGPEADRCDFLEQAEKLLMEDAENEAEGKSWWMHGANALINIGAGLILGLGFDRWESGAINAGAGLAIGEVMILTQPSDLQDDLQRYRSGDLGRDEVGNGWRWNLAPLFCENGYGLQLLASF